MGAHAFLGALPVRREDGFPVDVVLAAWVSAQPPQACGMLAIGLAARRSASSTARLFRRRSPRSIVLNSSAAQLITTTPHLT